MKLSRLVKQAHIQNLDKVREIVTMAVGEASMAWDPKPAKQVFDSTEAAAIADRTVEALKKVAAKDLLRGGKSDKIPPSAFPPKKVAEGAKVESEHTSNKTLAKEIARDHLSEDLHYYKKLKRMEKVASLPAFLDELEKISFNAGYAASVGSRFARGTANFAEGVGKNVGRAAMAFTTPKKSFTHGWDATWHPERLPGGQPLHPAFKALMGYGLLTGVRDVATKNDPTGRGHSRLRRALRFAGDQAGGIITAPFGFTGGMFGSMVGGKVGDLAGAATEKLRGYKPRRENAHLPPRPQGLQE